MKRAAALIGLSRQHHSALSLALHARRAVRAGGAEVAAMMAKVVAQFHSELEPHFEAEERWLLPALARAGETMLVNRTLADHAALADLAAALAASDAGPETLLAFADRLADHVRFEERELFIAAESDPGRFGNCQ